MVVNPSFPVKTIPEFIAYAKANPGKINMASAGIGTARIWLGELFKMMAGVDMLHVPYRGAGARADRPDWRAGAGDVRYSSSIGHIRAGKLRALAVTTAMRSEMLPDIPSHGRVRARLRGERMFWPRRTQAARPPRSSTASTGRSTPPSPNPRIKDRLADQGGIVVPGSPADFGKLIADETEKWAKVINFAGLKAE